MAEDFEDKSDQIKELATDQDLPNRLNSVHQNVISTNPNIGGEINNTAQRAVAFLQSKQPKMNQPLFEDSPAKPSISEQNKFLKYHSVINDPVSVLDHIKNCTLSNDHVAAMKSVYPDLHSEIQRQLIGGLSDMKNEGKSLTYHQRQSLGKYLGMPLDSTMALPITQAVIKANGSQQTSQAQGQQAQHKASGKELDQINKVNQIYNTPIQQRVENKKA